MADFVINRVLPRLPYIDRLYFIVTRGRFRAISLAEVLGRLVYCGFDITDYRVIGNDTYFIATKTRLPSEEQQPSYYPIIKLKRIGQDGKTIGIYKLRTMHPYSEFLQDYIVRHYGYNSLGKPDHDFRVTKWGRLLRKYWIDEIPQCMNLLKGELKLVGLRPLSYCKFQEFPVDLRRKRICFKSGLIPPYVSLCMSDEQGKMDAERIYIQNYTEHRLSADLQFFFKAVRNIMLNKVSSC
jgi:lipopolysaccharide/colanic/teichoic acid biosynthesis glycosyltransferase